MFDAVWLQWNHFVAGSAHGDIQYKLIDRRGWRVVARTCTIALSERAVQLSIIKERGIYRLILRSSLDQLVHLSQLISNRSV